MLGLPYGQLRYANPLNVNPIAISIGPLEIHWYALAYLVAFALYLLLALRRAGREGYALDRALAIEALFAGELGAYLGGRIGYILFYNLPLYLAHPFDIVAVWQGGMSFHGGLIGVIVALYPLSRREGKTLLAVTDFVAPMIPLGLAAGRLGNFINGNLFGRVCHGVFPWCAYFPYGGDVLRYPSQLFEGAGEGILLFLILWIYSRKPRPTGSVSSLFLISYGLIRFSLEFLRQPDPQLGFVLFGWMTMGQLLSIPMIVGGILMWFWSHARVWQPASQELTRKLGRPGHEG